MSHPLDRLLRLVKRTGDTLIVHNPQEEQDIVLLSIDRYEDLVMDNEWVGEDDWGSGPDSDSGSDWQSVGDILQRSQDKAAPLPSFDEDFSSHTPLTPADSIHHLEDVSSALITPIPSHEQTMQPQPDVEELRYEFPVDEPHQEAQNHSIHQESHETEPIQQTQPIPQKSAPVGLDFSDEEPLQGSGPVFFEEPV